MKKQIHGIIGICLLAMLPIASALELKDLEGSWKGKRTEIKNGQGINLTVKFLAKKAPDGGLVINETVTSSGMLGSRVKHTFKKSGTYRAIYIWGDFIVSSDLGRWRKTGNSISISGSGSSSEGKKKFSGSFKKPTVSSFSYSGKFGNTTIRLKAKRSA